MSPGERQKQEPEAPATEFRPSLLEAAIGATKQTEPDRARELLTALTEAALKGTVRFDRNVIKTVTAAVQAMDAHDFQAACGDHARRGVPEARRVLARSASPGQQDRDRANRSSFAC